VWCIVQPIATACHGISDLAPPRPWKITGMGWDFLRGRMYYDWTTDTTIFVRYCTVQLVGNVTGLGGRGTIMNAARQKKRDCHDQT